MRIGIDLEPDMDMSADREMMQDVVLWRAQVAQVACLTSRCRLSFDWPNLVGKASKREELVELRRGARLGWLRRRVGRKRMAQRDSSGRERGKHLWQPFDDRPIQHFHPLPALE